MEEINKRHCKVCHELKLRILDGKFPDAKNKKFRGEDGKLWNGSTCSACHVLTTKENIRKLRFKRMLEKKEGSSDGTKTT